MSSLHLPQIAGIAPSSGPWERLFMVFQAYIDDSYTENGTFVLGGYVATAETWATFSAEWEALLPTATRGRGGYRFKMSEMARQLDRVIPFYRVIENHVPLGLWCQIDIAELRRAKERIWSDVPLIWSNPAQPFWFCLSAILGRFHEERLAQETLQQLLPLEQKVNFYFDKRSAREATEIADDWDEFAAGQSEAVRSLYGTIPRFEDDEEFLPLQAADLCAWWVRRATEKGAARGSEFADLKPRKSITTLAIKFTEDQLVESLIERIRRGRYGLVPERPIYDAKYSPRPANNPVLKASNFERRKLKKGLRDES
jgi:hypothetical protein